MLKWAVFCLLVVGAVWSAGAVGTTAEVAAAAAAAPRAGAGVSASYAHEEEDSADVEGEAEEEEGDAEGEVEERSARHHRGHRSAHRRHAGHHDAALLETKENAAVSADAQADADLVQSLFKLVKQGSEQDKRLSAELSTEAAQSAALQSDLAAKQQALQRHQNLMKNLQICLAKGPDALSAAPAPLSALETQSSPATPTPAPAPATLTSTTSTSKGVCDCFALKQKLADARMELENSNSDEAIYKKQYTKAAALLTAAQKKLRRIRLAETQPTQQTLCDKMKTCAQCAAIDGCGWCGKSQGYGGQEKGVGMCRRLDVNARLRGFPKMDGMTSGECEAKSWQTAVKSRASLLSLNVFGSDLKNTRRRARTIMKLIARTDPTFVAFQEVEDWFLQALKLDPILRSYYQSDFGSGHAPGGLYILSKYPISKVSYNEQTMPGQVQYDMRARVLLINAVVDGQNPPAAPTLGVAQKPAVVRDGQTVVTIATTNLDWRSADARTDGMDFVFAVLSPYNDVILAGDFNFDHGALPESSHIPENWLDSWPALNPDNLGCTWDPDTNAYARASDPTSRPSRIDRVLVKSVHWLPRYIRLVGCSSSDLLCDGLFANPPPPHRPHALPQPLSQPHASTEANSPPLTALAKPSAASQRIAPLPPRPEPSMFLETASGAEAEVDAETDAEGMAVIPSNHYGLLMHLSKFAAKC